jgi:hypothetical protein
MRSVRSIGSSRETMNAAGRHHGDQSHADARREAREQPVQPRRRARIVRAADLDPQHVARQDHGAAGERQHEEQP